MFIQAGPYLLLNDTKAHDWCYFEVSEEAIKQYNYADGGWIKQTPKDTSDTLYAFCPEENKLMAFVSTPDSQLFKLPVLSQKLGPVFRPFVDANTLRWLPAHLTRASDFAVDVSEFPSSIDTLASEEVLNTMPALPSVALQAMPSHVDTLPVDVTDALRRCRGLEFHVSPKLSPEQTSHIVQFIQSNGDWPFTSGSNPELGLELLKYHSSSSVAELPIRKYRDPIFLAQLMGPTFYPNDEGARGDDVTVAHVWHFVNVLLAHGVRLMGHQGPIELPYPPKEYHVSSFEYLANHETPSKKRRRSGFSTAEAEVHDLVMDYAEQCEQPDFSNYTMRAQAKMTQVLKELIAKRAARLELSTSLFNGIANLFGMDGDSADTFLQLSCKAVLSQLCIEQALMLTGQLSDVSEESDEDEATAIIHQLTPLMNDIDDNTEHERLLSSLAPAYQAMLRASIEASKQIKAPGPGKTSIFSGHASIQDSSSIESAMLQIGSL